jgi:ketosteroid isomerase-like protein
MSRENVEVVLNAFRAFRERDDEALFANYAPGIVWDLSGYPWAEQPLHHGHDGLRQFFRGWLEGFEDYECHALDPLTAGERVVVTVEERAKGRRSGAPIERRHAQIWTLREGKVVRIQSLASRAEALEAVGLGE